MIFFKYFSYKKFFTLIFLVQLFKTMCLNMTCVLEVQRFFLINLAKKLEMFFIWCCLALLARVPIILLVTVILLYWQFQLSNQFVLWSMSALNKVWTKFSLVCTKASLSSKNILKDNILKIILLSQTVFW